MPLLHQWSPEGMFYCKSSPRQLVVSKVTFCQMHNNFTAYDSLHKMPSHTSTKITVHTPMSQEGIILFAWPVLCICSVLHLLTLLSLMHTQTHTLLLLSPWIFNQLFLLDLADQNLCRDTNSDSTVLRHRKPVRSLFELFFSFVMSKLLSSFRISPVKNSAQHFPPQLIWNSSRHAVSLKSMKSVAVFFFFVKIIKRLWEKRK